MDWITGITRLALGRPAVVFLVTLLVILAGVFAIFRLKTELFPDIDFPVVTVATSYPGASPSSVLEDVTIPVENAVAGIGDLQELHSISTENLSVVSAEFDYGTDMEKMEQEIEASVNNVVLPTGASQPTVDRIDLADFPIIFLGLLGERDVSELAAIAERDVLPVLERLDGVGRITIEGAAAERVEVTLNPQELSRYGLTTEQVVTALEENNVSRPSGIIDSEGRVLPVRTTSRYTSLEDIENLAVASSEAASPVLVADIGQVEMATDPFASISRTNGRPSLAISVVKEADANTVEVANSVQDKVNQLALPPGVEIVTLFDQSDYIEESIAALLREGALGFLFAVIVIYLFLTGVRTTLVTAVSIPLSIIIALIVLAWQGMTLNIITMAGLTVAIGRVVDDSIVVLENIYRHTRAGEKLSEAAYAATREVGTAVFASTLTTVAVFLPLALAGGLVGEIFLSFALTITIALLASLLVALTVVPVLARYLIQMQPAEGRGPRWLGWLLPFGPREPRPSPGLGEEETWLQRIYTPVLRWALAHRLATLTAGVGLFVASFALLPFIGISFLPGGGGDTIEASVELPPGTSLATTEAKAQEIEELVIQAEGLETYSTVIGQPDPSGVMASAQLTFGRVPTSGTIDMWLAYSDGVDMDEEIDRLRNKLNALSGEKEVSVQRVSGAAQTDQVDITITADSLEDLEDANDQLVEALKDVEDLVNVSSDLVSARPEIEVLVDSQKASAYGLSAEDVSQRVRDALFGQKATQAQLDGRTTDVYVRVDYDGTTSDEGALVMLPMLPLAPGGTPTLGDVGTVEEAESRVQVSRVDQRRAATIYGTITSDDLGAVSGKVDDAIAQVERAPGVEIEKGGIFEEQAEAFGSLYIVLAVAVLVVYIVMVASLGSLVNPLIIMASLPFATIGSFFALFITQREIGLPAMIGFLMLIGIVVTNAIVLITFVEQQRARGLPTREALIHSGRARARPILMTAVATIFALIPLSLGLNEGVLIAAELGTVVIGGLFTSTILTLLVIPVVYSLVDDARSRLRGQPADG